MRTQLSLINESKYMIRKTRKNEIFSGFSAIILPQNGQKIKSGKGLYPVIYSVSILYVMGKAGGFSSKTDGGGMSGWIRIGWQFWHFRTN